MPGKTGGTRKNKVNDQNIKFIPEVAEIIFNYLKPHYTIPTPNGTIQILDACCGDGVLGKSIKKIIENHEYTYQDIKIKLELQDIKINKKSILKEKYKTKFDIIVSNPPWHPVTLSENIYWKLISLLSDNGVLFYIIDNTFCYQGWDRAKELLYQKYYFLPRYVFKWSGKKLLDCGIMVYHRNNLIHSEAMNLNCYIHIPPNIIFEYKEDMIKEEKNLFNS